MSSPAVTRFESFVISLAQTVSWVLALALTTLTITFSAYQIKSLYGPYVVAKLTSDTSYRFPEYMYRVYGDELESLALEHWGYLGSALGVSALSIWLVLPDTPWKKIFDFVNRLPPAEEIVGDKKKDD
ncbi:hypothetical protein FOL47_002916 [Perkinsus chesapeaki]|uniref:Uncharacterized protein n=1 Tax=Perkinsus chesapeaki TaxID=330153 RepID=A0A7J6MBA5_PERCH|nr:hypothetical protein FOL47_002916 [Perkinsus chesapeaki]